MSEPPPPPIDIPPPPEAERLADLKTRRDELEQKLADEKAKLKRMQADRRALLRKQIKRARSRLSTAERKRRNQRLIQLGLLARSSHPRPIPKNTPAMLKDLDARLDPHRSPRPVRPAASRQAQRAQHAPRRGQHSDRLTGRSHPWLVSVQDPRHESVGC